MKLIVQKGLKGPEAVQAHELFGEAVFVECGLHDPENFCYDHHSIGAEGKFTLSSAGMVQQELLQRRRMPNVVVMNHVRHLDNLVALYLLWFRGLATHPDTSQLVAAAELMDRVGPLVTASIPQMVHSVLQTAQALIPFKEWEAEDEELKELAIAAVESLRGMVTAPQKTARVEVVWESADGKFVVVCSDDFIGNTLYDRGYDAYAAFTRNEDGSYKWTFARASEYVPFDIPSAFAELNALEGCEEGEGWGGRAVIGGSPRGTGTRLEPDAVLGVLKKRYSE